MTELLIRAPVGLLPVMIFLAALLYLDSYKLVKPRSIIAVIALGAAAAGISYLFGLVTLTNTEISLTTYSRYMAPVIEEILKGAVLVMMIRGARIGFLVDAAIFGFAVGTGFAMIENIYYLNLLPDAPIAVWVVRGFGTAIMHGGATAMFAIVSHTLTERRGRVDLVAFLPGLALAVILHSGFNHFLLSPVWSAIGIMVVLPPLIITVFERSESVVEDWLGVGFDADTELLELLHSGTLSDSHVGRYLHELKEKFQGPVVADLLCYLRLHVELAMRAKGIMMMREGGFAVEIDEETRAKFTELRFLEDSIGTTGRLAMQPFLHMSRKDLSQLYMLGT